MILLGLLWRLLLGLLWRLLLGVLLPSGLRSWLSVSTPLGRLILRVLTVVWALSGLLHSGTRGIRGRVLLICGRLVLHVPNLALLLLLIIILNAFYGLLELLYSKAK